MLDLGIIIVFEWHQFGGVWPVSMQAAYRLTRRRITFSGKCFKRSGLMLSGPAAFPLEKLCIAFLTSLGVIQGYEGAIASICTVSGLCGMEELPGKCSFKSVVAMSAALVVIAPLGIVKRPKWASFDSCWTTRNNLATFLVVEAEEVTSCQFFALVLREIFFKALRKVLKC